MNLVSVGTQARNLAIQIDNLEKIRDDLQEVLNSYVMADTCVDTANNYQTKRNKVVDAYNKIQGVIGGTSGLIGDLKSYGATLSNFYYRQ